MWAQWPAPITCNYLLPSHHIWHTFFFFKEYRVLKWFVIVNISSRTLTELSYSHFEYIWFYEYLDCSKRQFLRDLIYRYLGTLLLITVWHRYEMDSSIYINIPDLGGGGVNDSRNVDMLNTICAALEKWGDDNEYCFKSS